MSFPLSDHHHHHDHEHHAKGGKAEEKSIDDTQSHLAQLLENLKKSQNKQGFLLKQRPVQLKSKKKPNSQFKITLDGAAIDLGNLI